MQKRIVFADNGKIDPTEIDDYIARGGYSGLSRVLAGMEPDEVIDLVERSGLRGRGGASSRPAQNGNLREKHREKRNI